MALIFRGFCPPFWLLGPSNSWLRGLINSPLLISTLQTHLCSGSDLLSMQPTGGARENGRGRREGSFGFPWSGMLWTFLRLLRGRPPWLLPFSRDLSIFSSAACIFFLLRQLRCGSCLLGLPSVVPSSHPASFIPLLNPICLKFLVCSPYPDWILTDKTSGKSIRSLKSHSFRRCLISTSKESMF